MGINVRKATVEDYHALCGLFEEIDALHRDHLPHLFRKPDGPSRERDFYAGLIADEDIALFVAEAGGELVGAVQAIVRETPNFPILVPRRYVVVESIVVKSEFQNQGIGRALMEEMQAWAAAKGAAAIELNVYEFNQTAIAFYESLGYQVVSRKMSKNPKKDQPAG